MRVNMVVTSRCFAFRALITQARIWKSVFFFWLKPGLDKFILFTHSLFSLGLVQTPYFSCPELNLISFALERYLRHLIHTAYLVSIRG